MAGPVRNQSPSPLPSASKMKPASPRSTSSTTRKRRVGSQQKSKQQKSKKSPEGHPPPQPDLLGSTRTPSPSTIFHVVVRVCFGEVSRALQANPYATNMLLTLLAAMVGNAFTQRFVERQEVSSLYQQGSGSLTYNINYMLSIDVDRLLRFSFLKCVIVSCLGYPWNMIVLRHIGIEFERRLRRKWNVKKWTQMHLVLATALCKLFFDQIFFAPFLTFIHLTALQLLDNCLATLAIVDYRTTRTTKILLDAQQACLGVQDAMPSYTRWKTAMQGSYCIWPAAQLLNLIFVPQHWRLVCVQIVAIVWNAYLSWASRIS